jgi:RNA polymerase sigma factor (sigma-70 family)
VVDSDVTLFTKWQRQRDAEAFQEIVHRHASMVYATCFRMLRDSHAAEDAAQDCFVTLAQWNGRIHASLPGWLHRVAARRCLNLKRADARRGLREQAFASTHDTVQEASWDDIQSLVDEAIEHLPDKLRGPVVAHFLEGHSHQDLAEQWGLPRTTLTSRIQKGIVLVRKHLARRGVPIGTAALTGHLSAQAQAVTLPTHLLGALGRVALAGSAGTASVSSTLVSTTLIGALIVNAKQTVIVAALALLMLFMGSWGLYRLDLFSASSAQQDVAVKTSTAPDAEVGEPPFSSTVAGKKDKSAAPPQNTPPPAETPLQEDSIAGVVLTAEGIAASGVLVSALRGEEKSSETTDVEGAFRIASLAGGTYFLLAEDDDLGIACAVGIPVGATLVSLQLCPSGTIQGRVFDRETGKGIPNAHVYAAPTDHTKIPKDLAMTLFRNTPTRTDQAGNYTLQLPAPARYWMQLREAGNHIIPRSMPQIELAKNGHHENVDFPLAKGSSVSGRILSPAGSPVKNAEIALEVVGHDQGGYQGKTASDQEGKYSFQGLATGTPLIVRASHPDYGAAQSDTVTIRELEQVTELDVTFQQGQQLSGRVVLSSGAGVANMLVQLIEEGGHLWRPLPMMEARTEEDGAFVIAAIPPGTYQAIVSTGKAASTKVLGPTFTVEENGRGAEILIDMGAGLSGSISGRVLDIEEKPVPNAEIVAHGGDMFSVAQSESDGSYRLDGLLEGGVFGVEARGFRTGFGRTQQNNIVTGSENVDFILEKKGAISGRVLDAETGAPVPEFDIRWFLWPWKACASTQGSFELTGVSRNPTTLTVKAKGYTMKQTEPLELPSDKRLEDVEIFLQRGATVTIAAIDAKTGAPLPDVRVKLFSGGLSTEFLVRGTGWSALDPVTKSDGRCEMTTLPIGEPCNIVAWRKDFAPAVHMGYVANPEEELVFQFSPGGTLTGQVTENGAPLSGAMLVCNKEASNELDFTYKDFLRVEPSGMFSMKKLPDGRYTVLCLLMGTEEILWQDSVEIWEGQTTECSIDVSESM